MDTKEKLTMLREALELIQHAPKRLEKSGVVQITVDRATIKAINTTLELTKQS